MKLHLNLSLRRALMAAMATVCAFASTAGAGVVDERYDLQYYLDFSRNKGMFSAGATNIAVFFKDGTSIRNNVIPLMPALDSYGQTVTEIVALPGMTPRIASNGGTGLISAQFVFGARHVHAKIGNTPVAFLSEDASTQCMYDSANLELFGHDSSLQRLTKLVTSVAYTPMADDAFMDTISTNGTWIYRLGNGGSWSAGESIMTSDNALGGVVNLSSIWKDSATGDWRLEGWARYSDINGDERTPLDIGTYFGDSGSPLFAWDDANNRFVFISSMWASGVQTKLPNWYLPCHNPSQAATLMDKYTVGASFTGSDTILWSGSDAATGKGTLTQGSASVEYTGLGTGNSIADSRGLTFSTADDSTVQTLQLQGNVNMGAGALTFENGKWRLTELADNDFTLNSAGFEIKNGAELTWELTGASGQEIRKVGEGILTIAGSGNNESTLVVGGGTAVYNVTRDAEGNITGCTMGNAGETRLAREGGYAAASVRLEGGVAIIVLMGDNQFKTNSVAGDTFSFGNDGGLLNLNGHNLSWGVINQQGSGTGARIGNLTPLGETAPANATFTYTGTGVFAGCFMDEGTKGAQLGVVYNNATDGAMWTLTGNHGNAGGFTVEAGTMVLEGTNTPHVMMTDSADWTYATIQGGDVTVRSGAGFRLSHHALMQGNVSVEEGGSFVINQTVNAASESINGGLRQDMTQAGITSLVGNVTLNGAAGMEVSTESPATTTMQGNILSDTSGNSGFASFTKNGSGTFVVDGKMEVARGTVEEGGLVINKAEGFVSNWTQWTIREAGFLAVNGLDNDDAARCISLSSSGVLALTSDQETALDLELRPNLIIGAWGDISYGTADATLGTVYDAERDRHVWRLGGGTGTLTVNFQLTGDNDLIIGNEYSSGTVHLANTANDFTGKIIIQGLGNILSYDSTESLGGAKVSLPYGNAMSLYSAEQFAIFDSSSSGVLALVSDADYDMRGKTFSLGAAGDLTYTGNITVDDKYRFGGAGNLTLDTKLDGADSMELDAQGLSGSSVTFARKHAFTGDIVVGSALYMDDRNGVGDIAVHAGHEESLAAVSSIEFQKGSVLYTDGQNLKVSNLSMQTGSRLINNGESGSHLNLAVDAARETRLEDGVLSSATDVPDIHITKTGDGTLVMGHNSSWSGGLTISEGTVECSLTSTGWGYTTSGGGVGAEGSSINIQENGTLRINAVKKTGREMGGTEISQKVSGSGTIEFSSGGAALFSSQAQEFEGVLKLTDNTRLYLGSRLNIDGQTIKNTVNALKNATVEVTAGSQVRITSAFYRQYEERVSVYSDFILNGSGYNGAKNGGDMKYIDGLPGGALSIDFGSTVYGDITLASNAAISSISGNLGGNNQQCSNQQYYGIQGFLGGTIRGRILGVEQEDGSISALSITGNEGITITADSANTYGDLLISNSGTCRNSDVYALQLNGGKAQSQTSTALGTGAVKLGEGLILRLAGTGTANNSDVVYTYANTITAGKGATLQSHNITNRLTGTVIMSDSTLNLATAQGGVLELAGGISGSGTVNVAANSEIILGSSSGTMALSRNSAPQFSGTVNAGTGADITLASPSAVAPDTAFTGEDTLTLRLGSTGDYSLGSISLTDSDPANATGTQLTLGFDFTHSATTAEDADTYTTLTAGSITTDTLVVVIERNMFDVLAAGTYTLIRDYSGTSYSLYDNTSDNRMSLDKDAGGNLVLTVGEDTNRMYWSAGSATQDWNTSDANWIKGGSTQAFTGGSSVVLDASGVSAGNSRDNRETISLNTADQEVGALNVLEAHYEITGSHALNGVVLRIGVGGDLKLSTDATFEEAVVRDGALSISGSTLTLTKDNTATTLDAGVGADVVLEENAILQGNVNMTDSARVTVDSSTINGNISLNGTGNLAMDQARINGNIALGSTGSIETGGGATLSGSLSCATTGNELALIDGTATLKDSINLDALFVAAGQTLTIWNGEAVSGADKCIGLLELGENAVLQTNDRAEMTTSTGLGTVQLNGSSATIQDVNHSGAFAVNTLKLGDDITQATLNLKKNAESSWSTIFKLGNESAAAGNFAGTIALNEANKGSNRSAFIIIGHEDIARNALIDLQDAGSSGAHIGLGINTATATIAGLQSVAGDAMQAKLFSGTVNEKVHWHTGNSAPNTVGTEVRTLTIDTASNGDYTFHGEVMSHLNLVKEGLGKQTFTGNSENFDGSIRACQGTLAFSDAAMSMLQNAESVTISGGTLQATAAQDAPVGIEVTLDGDNGCLNVQHVAVSVLQESGTGNRIVTNGLTQVDLSNVKDTTIIALSDSADDYLRGTMQGGSLVLAEGRRNMATALVLDSTAIYLQGDDADIPSILNQPDTDVYTLADLGNVSGTAASLNIGTYDAAGDTFALSAAYLKYFSNLRLNNGAIQAERNTSYYSDAADKVRLSRNGMAGLALADAAQVELKPQIDMADGGLDKVLSAMDAAAATGNTTGMDELGSALAGAATAVLGMAAHGDLDRQLQAIRNRTTTMGVDQSVVHHEMPYFNAWINAEGDYSELSDDGTAGGYKLNSWGGTVGFDVDIAPTFTAGLALTAMYGDLDVTGADQASGELNSYYVSAFARYCASAWTHTFVATVGLSDITLNRTVMGEELEGDTEGMSFGLMYEVGRVFTLDEDGTACLQPLFNVTYRHTQVSGYEESGSDLALKVDDQTLDTVTFGVGARLQTIVGESMYNRTSIFECRLLAKFDAGDRQGSSTTALAALPGATADVESAERGGFGLEAGAGLTIPLGDEGGSLFMDASVELRADYTNVNGTVGYRVNF